jgi:hypothetical protein
VSTGKNAAVKILATLNLFNAVKNEEITVHLKVLSSLSKCGRENIVKIVRYGKFK